MVRRIGAKRAARAEDAPAAVSAPSEGTLAKRARVGAKACGTVFAKIGGNDEIDEEQERLGAICEALRGKHDLQVLATGVIKKHNEGKRQAKGSMRRGVEALQDLPDYIATRVLAECSGVCEGTWKSIGASECMWCVHAALEAGPTFELPRRETPVEDFLIWAAGRYAASRRLADNTAR